MSPLRVAATSFTIPGTVAQNCRHLAGAVPEVALLLFETRACLNYGQNDLPDDLARLPMDFHAHLPLDLPWDRGADAAWAAIQGLVLRLQPLAPRRYVLHPPPDPGLLPDLARRFARLGVDPGRVLLENIENSDLTEHLDGICSAGFGICLDLGHVLAYGQQRILTLPGLWDKVDMLHVYAPGPGARHESLGALDAGGRGLLAEWIGRLGPGACITLEVFSEPALAESARVLTDIATNMREGSTP